MYIFECVEEKKNILRHIGDDEIEGTPVPMPNTAVKLYDAEDTHDGENRGSPILYIPC